MNIKGIIFDNDGTLVDSERMASALLHQMLNEQGVALDADQVLERFRGVQFALFMADVALQAPQLDIDRFVSNFRAASLAQFRSGLAPMPGALAFVEALQLPSCVASNGPRDKIETTLEAAGLLPWFENRIVSAYEVNSWKPAPGLILAACHLLELAPHECLLVEDSHAGVQAGLAAGTQVAGYGVDTDFSLYAGRPGFHRAEHYRDLAALLAASAR
ncbi:HAD-IA family hydrolase [Pseudomonas sp. dw_358]|uniref:HAD family hydrolase n=1 Tax=Pseudomonas sp. dw_358 TaxID=2720083 RepID=UPI001BD3231A|nr:HAD-IA family hydrolase [Pseudomonas sp. dw_358]